MSWLGKMNTKFKGYEPVGDWRIYFLAPTERPKNLLPERIPVPRSDWGEWGDNKSPQRLEHSRIAEYATRFIKEHPSHNLAGRLSVFTRKAPLARQVEKALRERAWEEGENALKRVLEMDDSDTRAKQLLALCLHNQKKLDDALKWYDQIEAELIHDADFYAFKGGWHEINDDLGLAKNLYEKALELQDNHPMALQRMAGLGEMVEIFLGDLDNPEKAYVPKQAYEEAIVTEWQKETHDTTFYLDRVKFHMQNGQPNLAWRAAGFALDLCDAAEGGTDSPLISQRPTIITARCRAEIAKEDFKAAEATLIELEKIAPDSEAVHSCKGQLLWFKGQQVEAVKWINLSIEVNPNRVENLHLYLKPDYPRDEANPYQALINLNGRHPNSWAIKSMLALILMAGEKWDEAVPAACEAAKLGAADELLVELTGRLGRNGRHNDVNQVMEAAGGLESNLTKNAMLRSNLASSMIHMGKKESAAKLWRSVLDDEGVHPSIRLRARTALESVESGMTAH